MACGRAAEAPSGREPAGLYACDSGEGRHRGRAQGKQGPGVRTVRRGHAARRTVIDAGVEDQAAEDRQAALPVRVTTALEPPSAQDFDCAPPSTRLSMTTFGTIRPKLIAKMIVTAVMPSETVAARSSRVVFEPLVSSSRPLAILKRKAPGIIDTTAAKPMAANGMCQRRATGVRISPTTRHATNAPVAAPQPTVSVHHLRA